MLFIHVRVTLAKEGAKMHTKILAAVYVALAVILALASAPVARADGQPATNTGGQADRDVYQCLQSHPEGLVPPEEDLKTCMLQKGYSDEETTDLIGSLPYRGLPVPDTGDLGRGDNGAESGGI
jgi:hypothetical protein